MKNCGDCKKDILCDNCDKIITQKKEFSAILIEMKREASYEFGHLLPNYITT